MYKWGKQRATQQWTLLCSTAPKIMKSVKEVPDTLRKLVGMKLKFSKGRASSSDDGTVTLPGALTDAVSFFVAPWLV